MTRDSYNGGSVRPAYKKTISGLSIEYATPRTQAKVENLHHNRRDSAARHTTQASII